MYKTLSKLTNKRTTIPVLSMIQVKDGIATATNMDVMIQSPCALKDGMYHGHCFANNIHLIDENINIDDMPIIDLKGEKVLISFEIDADDIDDLRWVSIAMSNDDTRYYLQGINVSNDGRLVATDGHRLHVIHKDCEYHTKEPENRIIWKGAISLFFDLFKELKAETAKFEIYESKMTITIGDHVITAKLIDGTYPQFQKVIPNIDDEDGKAEFITTPFDASEFKDILPTIKAVAKSYGESTVCPPIKYKNGEWIPSVAGCQNPPTFKTKFNIVEGCGFNATYLSQLCDGIATLIDKGSPMRVDDRRGKNQKLAVLMPLMV